MLGPLVNAAVIVVCSLAGRFLVKGIPERFEDHVRKAVGLAVVFLGMRGALENADVLLLLVSVISGAAIGEFIDIDGRMNRFGLWAEKRLAPGGAVRAEGSLSRGFAKGFVSASILFCTGSMALVGSLQSGLQGNHEILFAKSVLDGTVSFVFGATFGIGTAFSALPVLLYQGGIVLASRAVGDLLSPEAIREMSAVGSLLVAGIGFNFFEIKEIKIANLLPAVFIPLIWLGIAGLF